MKTMIEKKSADVPYVLFNRVHFLLKYAQKVHRQLNPNVRVLVDSCCVSALSSLLRCTQVKERRMSSE